MQRPVPGQRWISTSEPTLGLGIVLEASRDRVEIAFPATAETRIYALESAPLVRVRFKPGDRIAGTDGPDFEVTEVTESAGLLSYRGDGIELPESGLLDSLSFTSPVDRLLAGLCDDFRDFDLRRRVLDWNSRIRSSPARGFCGARIDLIPHQLAIVSEVCQRIHPRVLLADEVGLGKTIEACLILQHLQTTGRASRILILVPEPLIHQWFVELLRRFNLCFAIYDEARCEALTEHQPDDNPFSDTSLVLAPVSLLAGNPERATQAADAGFDMLIVDEAHHLEWSPQQASPEYAAVETLAAAIPSVLLLTATPQQLGAAGHFARLRLLDPAVYPDLTEFLAEAEHHAPLAGVVETLRSGGVPDDIPPHAASPRCSSLLDQLAAGDESTRGALADELLDRFGTGRVLFRNTRRHLTGFPGREPHLHPLAEGESPYTWLAGLLRSLPDEEKILLITGSPEAAATVRERLLEEIHVESSLFHEDLSLLQRDRNAAWFADPEGARILICSEIGSEGRNFQFTRHLVLFGLPRDPELLEQRIGRLDRIGQTGTIHIHVPYGVGSASEFHARWLHEGLDAFSRPLRGATTLAEELLPELDRAVASGGAADLDGLLERSRTRRDEVAAELDSGHDRLLELSAPPPERADEWIDLIEGHDEDAAFERFVIRLFDRLGLDVSDHSARTYHLARGQRLSEAFADLPDEGVSATFDRANALAREDLELLGIDHPMVRGAIDHHLGSESGNATFATWDSGLGKAILLEANFVLEAPAPGHLHIERFLPPTAVAVCIDHHGRETTAPAPALLQPGDPHRLIHQETFRNQILPKMMEGARKLAGQRGAPAIDAARQAAETSIRKRIARLETLAGRNPRMNPDEILLQNQALADTLRALGASRLRLDSLRLVWRT
ncbi:MAG: RNA polymerase-associated protein RapA [Akkermansiaceae bacterium]|nr:RNA polymerase-associated protein RapA [Akkermansiaceae bacterium]